MSNLGCWVNLHRKSLFQPVIVLRHPSAACGRAIVQTSSRRSASSHGFSTAQTGSATSVAGTFVRVCSRYDCHLQKVATVHVCTALLMVGLFPGQTFDSIMTLDMQIFGPTLTTFPPESQAIIAEGVANFLKSGVTASQITLTVKDFIAAVSHLLAGKSLLSYHLTPSSSVKMLLQLALQPKQLVNVQPCS